MPLSSVALPHAYILTAKQGSATNAHIAEERGLSVDDSGLDEEDKSV